jgi:hypothetical protein
MLLQGAPIFGTRFLAHPGGIGSEWQRLPTKSLDGHGLEVFLAQQDVKHPLRGVDEQHHRLACERVLDVIEAAVHLDGAALVGSGGRRLARGYGLARHRGPPPLVMPAGWASRGTPRGVSGCHRSGPGWDARCCSGRRRHPSPHAPRPPSQAVPLPGILCQTSDDTARQIDSFGAAGAGKC